MIIGVCDDNELDRHIVTKWIRNNCPEITENQLFEFSSGEYLLEFLKYNIIDVLFLDGKMPGLDGITTGSKIRAFNNSMQIIMFSDYINFAVDGYGIEVSAYILKPQFSKLIDETFKKVKTKYLESESSFFEFTSGSSKYKIKTKDILYFQSVRKIVEIHTLKGKEYEFYDTLDNVEKKLKECWFSRCHKSYLVNCDHIHRCTAFQIYLYERADFIPISRQKSENFNNDFRNFIMGRCAPNDIR